MCPAGRTSRHGRDPTGPTVAADQAVAYLDLVSGDGRREFGCTDCGARYFKFYQLARHQRSHSNERAFKCGLCPAAFNQSGHLAGHMRVHTGLRAYACRVCDERFVHSSQRARHQANVHGLLT